MECAAADAHQLGRVRAVSIGFNQGVAEEALLIFFTAEGGTTE